MTKMILSLWTIHIFSLEIDNLDEHQLVNKGWNKCEKREYEHYEKLRSAQVKDEALGEVELDNAYVSFTKCLQMFFSIFHENYSGILKNITVYSIDLQLQKVKEEKLRRIKESRKTLRTNIVQEQTMEQGMPAGEQKILTLVLTIMILNQTPFRESQFYLEMTQVETQMKKMNIKIKIRI